MIGRCATGACDQDRAMTAIDDTVLAASVAGLAEFYRSGLADPVAVTEGYLARIDHSPIGAFVALDRAGALAAARASAARWCAGQPVSLLDGVPIAIKANIAVAGLPWTAGVAAYADRIADADAACVADLRRAGAVILGLTNMDEGALGARGDNTFLGRCHNPHAFGYSPGGSSGGSAAAVAAGLCAAALGTDTIGSVRIPAAYCGVFGHKPRQARFDQRGVVPLSPRFDHVGVIARSADDCAAMLDVAVADAPVRLGVLDPADCPGVAPDVAAALARVAVGAVPVRLRFDFAKIRRLLLIVAEVEGAIVHRIALADRPEGFSPGLARMLHWGAGDGRARYDAALADIAQAAQNAEAALADVDALLLPSTPHPAFAHGAPAPDNQADFMTLAIAQGWPATAFPTGFSNGLPIGAQVIARDDATSLGIARALAC
jgi:aspartyl-tRNA(Asn)/glutamyl-tRNA(Gln) amidotransferase subunit A